MIRQDMGTADKAVAVKAEIDRILALDPGKVRVLWRKTFKKDVSFALTTQLLVRMLVWKTQEDAFGGYDVATLRLLDAYGRQDADKVALFKKLKPGTSVVREYQGVRHIVTIAEDSFVWQDRPYNSLSAIAREITGARWNGPRFFGLRAQDNASYRRKAS
jgi:Protein of unknown function (DUF2924)